jgi:ferredoxin-NADP reductase
MRITSLTLETVTDSNTGAVEFTFRPAHRFPFRAGQAGLMVLPGAGARLFTFASNDRTHTLSIATTLSSGSRFKLALGAMVPGARAFLAGPIGARPAINTSTSQVLVAQGIGITPFLSMARSMDRLNATLLQVGTPHYFDDVAATTTSAIHLDHRSALQDAVAQTIAERPDARWSLSGRSDFIAAVAAQLTDAAVPTRNIHKDAFWTMHPTTPAIAPARLASI